MYGPGATFAGIPAADLDDPESLAGAAAVIIGAPFDGRTSHRPGCRFGPLAIRTTDYLSDDGRRPHLALGVDPWSIWPWSTSAMSRCLRATPPTRWPGWRRPSTASPRRARSRWSSEGTTPSPLPDVTGVARHVGWGRVSVLHFDAHADTADLQFGSLVGHGTPMRRLIESGAVRGDRLFQIGLRATGPIPTRWRGWRTRACAAAR
jgi:arginase family enzyme